MRPDFPSPISRSQMRASRGMKNASTTTFVTLKSVCAIATCRPRCAPAKTSPSALAFTRWKKAGARSPAPLAKTNGKVETSTTVPITLKSACASAVRFAFAFVPIAASAAVTVVPMLSPRTIGTAVQMLISPASARAIVMPIVADELCTTIVQSAPTAMAPSTLPSGR